MAELRAAGPATFRLSDRGDAVVDITSRLTMLGLLEQPGRDRFDDDVDSAVRAFQQQRGLCVDGVVGPSTYRVLDEARWRLGDRLLTGPHLHGKIVVIDAAAVTLCDPDLAGRAAAITDDLAHRVEGRLVATGVQAFLTHRRGAEPQSGSERAEFANRTDANLCVSLHLDSSETADASGVSTYFYGLDSQGIRSSAGERFAGLVQREIVARTDLADLRVHPKTWDLLRRTRMPAVCIDVGYITNRGDAARLSDPDFRDVIAEAIVVAVQRVYLPPETDPETGVLQLGDLREPLREGQPR